MRCFPDRGAGERTGSIGHAAGSLCCGRPIRVDAPGAAFVQQFVVDLPHGISLVRPVVAHGPASVSFVFVDQETVSIPADAESPRFLRVFPDKKAHAQQGHTALGAVFLQLVYGFRLQDTLGPVLNIVRVFRPAFGALFLVRGLNRPAEGALSRGSHDVIPPVSFPI